MEFSARIKGHAAKFTLAKSNQDIMVVVKYKGEKFRYCTDFDHFPGNLSRELAHFLGLGFYESDVTLNKAVKYITTIIVLGSKIAGSWSDFQNRKNH